MRPLRCRSPDPAARRRPGPARRPRAAIKGPPINDVTELTRALVCAAAAHANRRRKGAAPDPCINHPIEVCDLVARATGGRRMDAIVAALRHAALIFDGLLRPILIARIRTDSTEAVVAFAQALCRAFDQRFGGIEVSGRYIRVHSDDTC